MIISFLSCISGYIGKYRYRIMNAERKADELFNQRVKFLKKKQYEYYYTMAINSPEILCDTLANRDIEAIKRKNLVFSLYSKSKK